MGTESNSASREAQLADLAGARADLVETRKGNLRKLVDFRSALAIARMVPGQSQDTVCGDSGVGDGITVAELERLVRKYEVEDVRVTKLLALVDARIARAAPAPLGPLH